MVVVLTLPPAGLCHWQNVVVVVVNPSKLCIPSVLCHDLCRGFRKNSFIINYSTYALIGCFRRNAQCVLREMLVATNNPGTRNEYMCVANCRHCTFLWMFCKRSMNNIYSTYDIVISHRIQSKPFSTPPSDERFMFKIVRIRADVLPILHTSATTPAAPAVEQAAVQALSGCSQGMRARWRKKQTKRSVSSREKDREARRALGFPLLRRHDFGLATIVYLYIQGSARAPVIAGTHAPGTGEGVEKSLGG